MGLSGGCCVAYYRESIVKVGVKVSSDFFARNPWTRNGESVRYFSSYSLDNPIGVVRYVLCGPFLFYLVKLKGV